MEQFSFMKEVTNYSTEYFRTLLYTNNIQDIESLVQAFKPIRQRNLLNIRLCCQMRLLPMW